MYLYLPLCLVLAASLADARTQESPAAGTPTFRANSSMVMVPVVVRDHDGRAVADLTQDRFQLFDKGKEQAIAAFSVERTDAGKTSSTPPAQFIAYFFDDATMHDFSSVMPLREAALHQFAGLRPSDRVAVFSSSCRLTLDFTDDRGKLQEVISKLDPNPVRICRVAPTMPLQITLLDAIVKRMAHLPGAKRIVVVSPGFAVNRDEQKIREALIDEAAQTKVSIDSLHIVESMGSQGPWNPNQGSEYDHRMPSGNTGEVNSENLNIVADGTGGTVVEAGNAPEAGLRALSTPECVYMLGFTPTEKADGSYHKLRVNLKESRKFSVRARAGYYATDMHGAVPPPVEATAAAPETHVTSTPVSLPPAKVSTDLPEKSAHTGPVAFRARTNLVQVPVVVRDRNGNPVGNLHKGDFQIVGSWTAAGDYQFQRGEAGTAGDGDKDCGAIDRQRGGPIEAAGHGRS